MASLYKRYVPPGDNSTWLTAASSPYTQPTSRNSPSDTRRKRERTDEDIAERKAKRPKNKGKQSGSSQVDGQITVSAPVVAAVEPGHNDDDPTELPVPQGTFAHVKNAQKRHKLEKEARKARKALARSEQGKATGHDSKVDEAQALGTRKAVEEVHTGIGGRQDIRLGDGKKAEDTRSFPLDKTKSTILQEEGKEQRSTAAPESAPATKKRRHKLESVLRPAASEAEPEAQQEDDAENEDAHLKKHKGILGKFQKALEAAPTQRSKDESGETTTAEQQVLRDLAPLPQPVSRATPDTEPEYSALPQWLAQPIVIAADLKKSFASLGLASGIVERLSQLGFVNALPVQQSIIPLLIDPGQPGSTYLPGTQRAVPDLAVNAPTGSGKTIAYLVPIIEALRSTRGSGRLQALVIVPTRELVAQVVASAESLAQESGVRIGSATGAGRLRDEQAKLIAVNHRFDPDGYERLMAKAHLRNYPPGEEEDEFEGYLDEMDCEDDREERRLSDAVAGVVDHVPTYESSVDLLVCTPGRLLEHLTSTIGFTLASLRWLVLDEADKLLGQQYDGFLEKLSRELSRERSVEEQSARERYLREQGMWNESTERRVRKIMLSATMTRDISKLVTLKLWNPKMLIVRGSDPSVLLKDGGRDIYPVGGPREVGDGFELPPGLVEFCIPAGDGSEKPLHLVELLHSRILPSNGESRRENPHVPASSEDQDEGSRSDDSTDTDSQADSSESSVVSSDSDTDASSASASDSDSDDDDDDDDAEDHKSDSDEHGRSQDNLDSTSMHPARVALLGSKDAASQAPNILIFTSSNESATRLSHLLRVLKPQWRPYITLLTKSQPTKRSRGNLGHSRPSITISTDRAARGLDRLGNRVITHVIQYDVPRSLTSYVHRVGRTARARRSGEAWTLYTHTEARWFLHEVTRSAVMQRAQPVEKVKIELHDQSLADAFREALEGMREEVYGAGKREVK